MKVTIDNINYMVDDKGKVEIKETVSAEYNREGIEIGDYRLCTRLSYSTISKGKTNKSIYWGR